MPEHLSHCNIDNSPPEPCDCGAGAAPAPEPAATGIERFLDTWAPHCGAPRAVFEGQFRVIVGAALGEARELAKRIERSRCAQWARWWALAHDYHAAWQPATYRRQERRRPKRDRGRDTAYKAMLCMLSTIEKGEDPEAPMHLKPHVLLEKFFDATKAQVARS